jgi:dephospho-CoA kinase
LAAAVKRFGQAILNEDGTLDRKKLGSIVFQQPEERKALEAITHPAIRREMRERAAAYALQHPDKLVVSDIPLLYESGLEDGFEEVMVVYVPRLVQRDRLMSRDGMTAEQAEARMDVQMDIERKKHLADIVIDNSGLWPATEQQIDSYLQRKGLL